MAALAFLAGMLSALVVALVGVGCLLAMQAAEQRPVNYQRPVR